MVVPLNTGWKIAFGAVLMLAISMGHADTSDWVQVERFEQLRKQANNGKVSAMYDVGRHYERGMGTRIDYRQAVKWYQQASEAGYAPAKARLGILYFEGRGLRQNHHKAHELLSQAAKEGVPDAQYQLALMYEWGTVVEQSRDQALYWYRKALKGGDYRAKSKLKQLKTKSTTPPTKIVARTKAKTPANKPGKRPHPTLATILNTQWTHASKPASYLPSTICQCRIKDSGTVVCSSHKQVRKTPSEIITFDTEATLNHVRNKEFTLQYVHTIVEVTARSTIADALDEDESAAPSPRVKVGQKSKSRKLSCRLINSKRLRCSRDRIYTYDFHG